jgi:hypothetical protein
MLTIAESLVLPATYLPERGGWLWSRRYRSQVSRSLLVPGMCAGCAGRYRALEVSFESEGKVIDVAVKQPEDCR